jgi:putative Mg2+ transporter-C (MgtC) family protein
LRPVVNAINRQPINDEDSEVIYQLCVIVDEEQQKYVMAKLEQMLEDAQCPLSNVDVTPFGDDDVEITATLPSGAVESATLDAIIEKLIALPQVKQVFWSNPSTTE